MARGPTPGKEPILMEKRKWSSQQKLQIVLEGLSGQIEISKLCAKYQIAQTQYYQWRDQLLKYGQQAFEVKNVTKKEQHLELENQKPKKIIGDLTIEL
jgi:transposase-like protein